jgi:GDP-4-dehydro-6-deoxy-D-mannose reductase
MKALITGIAGFAGSHLAELLLESGDEVCGCVFPGESTRNLDGFESDLQLFTADIRDSDAVSTLVAGVKPDAIYHLAAIAFIPDSIADPRLTFETNLMGSMNLFEAAKKSVKGSRILFVGSADEYGVVREGELPVNEENPLRPANPYSVSKVSASMLAYQYGLSGQLDVVRVRPFNHTGPRQSPQFVCSDFARQIVEVEKKKRAADIQVGNLNPKRDFSDVRDVVRAYREIVRHGERCEVYNICSGTAVEIREILNMLVSASGQDVRIVERQNRVRKSEVKEIRGDFGKLERATGWKPSVPLQRTLEDLLEYWRGVV